MKLLMFVPVLLQWALLCQAADVTSVPLADLPERQPRRLFQELPSSATGVDFVPKIDVSHPNKAIYVGGYASPGLAVGDLNGDSLPDLFVTGGPVANRLYLHAGAVGEVQFREAARQCGVSGMGHWSAGVTLVDIDNDADLDIYICNYDAPNELYINLTEDPDRPRFVERASEFGLAIVDASFASAFCDYDRDGDLDVYISAYQFVNPAGRPAEPPVVLENETYRVVPEFQKYYGIIEGPDGRPTFTNVGRRDYLLENVSSENRVRFRDVTQAAGISGLGVGNSMLWWDYNQDGYPDLYVSNDFKVADQLYRNNRDGTFTDVVRQAFPHTTWFSMGSEAGDLNNDGRIDLLVSDMAGTTHYRSKVTMGEMSVHKEFMKTANPPQYMRNALFMNTGTPRFLEAAYLTGLAKSDWSWAVKLADFDNDGWLDVFITNGAARMFNHSDRNFTDEQRIGKTQWELWEDTEPRREENLAFRNTGELRFESVGTAWGLKRNGMSYAAVYGDLDRDGDLDLVVANLDEPLSIYQNQGSPAARVQLSLRGHRGNRFGVGAVVRIRTGDGLQMRELTPSQGFLSCNEPLLHFGLGKQNVVQELTIDWPSGKRQVLRDLPANRKYVITEPQVGPRTPPPDRTARPWFRPSRGFPALRHVEQDFDDYQRQPLLPYAHSRLGPALAVADVNGDQVPDYYLGRARGARRAVYLDSGQRIRASSILEGAESFEDMGALFFDVDSDGDQDLYVVSGGVECEKDADALRDRLYLNDGKGALTVAPPNALPQFADSGGVVCAADFDRDGDLDLFVGGRVIPGEYPLSPASRLLENHGQAGQPRLDDVTASRAPSLRSTGLVTGAVWSDANNDGWMDLLVTHEWGPVKYFQNERADEGAGRRLVDRTHDSRLGQWLGWWNGVASRDLDNDGDVDYVVTNFGLNTKYKASDQKPELLYYGLFDASGKPHLLEAKFEGGKCVPHRGLSCSSHAMPFVREKMRTFHDFGLSSLQEIYTEEKLTESLRLVANTLESGVMVNLGNDQRGVPRFRFQPFPRLAQISPAFGVVVSDFDADGVADIFLAQNFFSPQLETGRMDSGMSMVLRGKQASAPDLPSFEPMGPLESGIIIPGDAMACCLADINRDGWNDLLVTVNNGPIAAFELQRHVVHKQFVVKLIGKNGNLDCVGARVTLEFEDRPSQTQEVTAGSGYLSQSSTLLTFGRATHTPTRVRIRWPDGETTQLPLAEDQMAIGVRQD